MSKTVHLLLAAVLCLAVGMGVSFPLEGSYQLVVDLLSKDGDVRRKAGERLVASGDKSLLAALNDVLAFYYVIQDGGRAEEVVKVMEHIAGEKVPNNPKLGWMKWIGRHQEIKPKPGYLAFKRSIFNLYDPAFRRFLDPNYTFRIRPEEIEWGGVKKDGIPALQNPSHIRAADAKGDVPAAVEFGRVAAAPVNTLRQQAHRCQEISVCF